MSPCLRLSPSRYHAITIFAGLLTVVFATSPTIAGSGAADPGATPTTDAAVVMVAREEIEYLRRQYALATDLIGTNTPEAIAEGRAIYRNIFAPDVEITVSQQGEVTLISSSPDAWVELVIQALGTRFSVTQHMIGTQLVTIERMPSADARGEASMSSYIQAWKYSDELVDIFIGTYHDRVRHTPETGWQIYRMNLEPVAHEVRKRP